MVKCNMYFFSTVQFNKGALNGKIGQINIKSCFIPSHVANEMHEFAGIYLKK